MLGRLGRWCHNHRVLVVVVWLVALLVLFGSSGAAGNAFSGASPGMAWPLLHLIILALVLGVLARLAIRRLA